MQQAAEVGILTKRDNHKCRLIQFDILISAATCLKSVRQKNILKILEIA